MKNGILLVLLGGSLLANLFIYVAFNRNDDIPEIRQMRSAMSLGGTVEVLEIESERVYYIVTKGGSDLKPNRILTSRELKIALLEATISKIRKGLASAPIKHMVSVR